MNCRKHFTGFLAFWGMFLLILDSRCALENAQAALEFCIRTVIPSLFPFLFLSGLVTETLWDYNGQAIRFLANCLNIPSSAHSLVVSGFLGGYPAGAHSIGESFRTGSLKKAEAQKLLSFCNNAGPAFIFGMIAQQFPEKWMAWSLWIIHILSAGMVGALVNCKTDPNTIQRPSHTPVTNTITNTIKVTSIICGWVILFRIILGFLDRWFLWALPEIFRVGIWGILELSNGCCALSDIDTIPARFVVCSAMLSFGGICVIMQTASVTQGLSIAAYLRGKLMQTGFSILLAVLTIYGYGLPAYTLSIFLMLIPKLSEKRSSIPKLSGV